MSHPKNEMRGTGQDTLDPYSVDRCEITVKGWAGDKNRVELTKVFRGGDEEFREFVLKRDDKLILNYYVDTEQMVGHEVQRRVEDRMMWIFLGGLLFGVFVTLGAIYFG